MNITNDSDNINENNNEKKDYLVKSTTFLNNEKIFECSSKIASADKIKINDESVEILMSNNNLTDHIISVMGHVNTFFTKKINDKKGK
ncbi:conserved Plasmodium protein, unknown function [Plasmodium gallinaceum]|uniref:Uncharacterized protein n=1 Tax=Plasmodium gallinaceum TaxID=5849 RepID=A0A1J1GNI5_PLAGA|nr:conserved Plasmodium protein, unknown function [Plasmodium gallinaceum]CRG94018.1 conserved Plasmodium protein, unknown function [Plasmodium gallinaceum]